MPCAMGADMTVEDGPRLAFLVGRQDAGTPCPQPTMLPMADYVSSRPVEHRAASIRTLPECALYPPVRDMLVGWGFIVRGEVGCCDVVAIRDDDLIAVELKTAFNTKLLIQATRRQRSCDSVYVAVPGASGARDRRGMLHLLRRLELGLIEVDVESEPVRARVVFHPVVLERRGNPRQRRAMLTEMAGRSGDFNLGGITRVKLTTAYREQALCIASLLAGSGPTSPKRLREAGAGPRTGPILLANHYGWFERLGHACYGLTGTGRSALALYADVLSAMRQRQPATT